MLLDLWPTFDANTKPPVPVPGTGRRQFTYPPRIHRPYDDDETALAVLGAI